MLNILGVIFILLQSEEIGIYRYSHSDIVELRESDNDVIDGESVALMHDCIDYAILEENVPSDLASYHLIFQHRQDIIEIRFVTKSARNISGDQVVVQSGIWDFNCTYEVSQNPTHFKRIDFSLDAP